MIHLAPVSPYLPLSNIPPQEDRCPTPEAAEESTGLAKRVIVLKPATVVDGVKVNGVRLISEPDGGDSLNFDYEFQAWDPRNR